MYADVSGYISNSEKKTWFVGLVEKEGAEWHVLCKFLPFFVPSDFQDTPPHCQKQCKQILKIDLTPATLVQL